MSSPQMIWVFLYIIFVTLEGKENPPSSKYTFPQIRLNFLPFTEAMQKVKI